MRAAIHQPDFFPWLGFFHKISTCDEVIFFDHVQLPRGKSWASRNKILLNDEEKWLTLPIRKSGMSEQKYFEAQINYDENFQRKHLGTIRQAYLKCPFFNELFPEIEKLYAAKHERLIDFNKEFIQTVAGKLGYHCLFRSSLDFANQDKTLEHLSGNELVLRTAMKAGATEYISGKGCLDFIQPSEFKAHGIHFFFQEFIHPVYPQKNNPGSEFVSHLSSLDALFNIGYEGVRKALSSEMLELVN